MPDGRTVSEAWDDLFRAVLELPGTDAVHRHLHGPAARTEGYRFLARNVAYELLAALTADDPAAPGFVRLGDALSKTSAPNPDNICRRCAVSPDGVYRIWGEMGSCEHFLLSTVSGRWHFGTYEVHRELSSTELGLKPGDRFELVIGGATAPATGAGAWLPLDDGVEMVQIREYYHDESDAPPATFLVERLDTVGVPPPGLTEAALVARLDRAREDISVAVPFWTAFTDAQRERSVPNEVVPPVALPGGSSHIRYGSVLVRLRPDEVLLLEFAAPPTGTWAMQLSSIPWAETVDEGGRTSNLNHRLAHVDRDGRVRVAVAGRDPGTANWIDTEGRAEVRLLHRWIDVDAAPDLTARVVSVADVAAALPEGSPAVDADARRALVARRQRHLAARTRA